MSNMKLGLEKKTDIEYMVYNSYLIDSILIYFPHHSINQLVQMCTIDLMSEVQVFLHGYCCTKNELISFF